MKRPPRPKVRLSRTDIELIVRLYAAGMTSREIGAHFGCSYRTILRRLQGAGIETPHSGIPLPRAECAREGCENLIKRTDSVYCSKDCLRVHPPARPRNCARRGCTVVFTPLAEKAARGAGRFCSPECWYGSPEGRQHLYYARACAVM